MKRVVIPHPPNANDPSFKTNQLAFNRAVSDWMAKVKSNVEDASRVNDRPMAQQFVVNTFTTNTTISSTSTLTDVANFVASLVQAMVDRGLVSQTVTRENG